MEPNEISNHDLDGELYFEDGWFIARCFQYGVAGRGVSENEATQNMLEAVANHLGLSVEVAAQMRCHSFSQLFRIEVPVSRSLGQALASMPNIGKEEDFTRHQE